MRAATATTGRTPPVVHRPIGSLRAWQAQAPERRASRLEFAVLGDTVNVASRLERLTRDLDTELVVSDALVTAVRSESAPEELLADLAPGPAQQLRGRDQPVAIWTGVSTRRRGDAEH